MTEDIRIPGTRITIGRFLFLLVSMLLFFLLRPFLEGFVAIRILLDIFFTIILISAVYAVSKERPYLIVALTLAVPAVLIHWTHLVVEAPSFMAIGDVFAILFYLFITTRAVSHLFRVKDVTFDLITGAVCGYFLMGMMWTHIYFFLEYVMPGSFSLPEGAAVIKMTFFYYSFVTLTTLGYGDITPVSSPAKSLAVLESVAGQIYLAVLIARLMGLSIADFQKRS